MTVRSIPVGEDRLQIEAVRELEVDDGVLVIRRIRVVAHLKADASHYETAQQVQVDFQRTGPRSSNDSEG